MGHAARKQIDSSASSSITDFVLVLFLKLFVCLPVTDTAVESAESLLSAVEMQMMNSLLSQCSAKA